MKLKRFSCLLAVLTLIAASCKKEKNYEIFTISPGVTFQTLTELPSILPESSGIEVAGPDQFFSLNDSKGEAELYVFDTTGKLTRTVNVDNASNEDWEDLGQDPEGNIYIADCGNNDNDRKDLKIYRIPSPSTFSGNSVLADTITFIYENQTKFPPPDDEAFFDSESIFIFNDSIFLLIKDRSKPFEGKTLVYQMPSEPGQHKAVLKGEFRTLKTKKEGAITSADISPSGLKMAMVAQKNVWVFSEYEGNAFFDGKVQFIPLPVEYQMEGIVFVDDCLLYLTNEKSKGQFSSLHQLKICD